MKNIKLLTIFLAIVLYSCEPNDIELEQDFVKLTASISDTAETIYIGDTLKIKFQLPETLVTTKLTYQVNTLNEGWVAFDAGFIDSAVAKSYVRLTSANFFYSTGYGDSYIMNLDKSKKPFNVVLNIIPTKVGIYHIGLVPQPSVLKINDFKRRIGFALNFINTNKHWNLIDKFYFNNDIPNVLATLIDEDKDGYGNYFFRVK